MPSTRQPSVVNPGPGRLSAGQIPDTSSGGTTADEVGSKLFSTPVRTALVTAGGPVASIGLGSNTFVGDVGSYPLDVLFSVVDQFDRAIFNAGTRVVVSSITGASVGDGFTAGAVTLNLTPSIPTTTQYRVYYGARSTLSVLPVDALTTNRTYNLYADRISYAGSPNWTTGSPLTAATVEAALDAIVTDLAATAGGTRIGFAPTATWADSSSIAAGSLSGAINEILSDLGGTSGAARIGAAISGSWADASGIAAATVAAAIGEVVTDLGGSSGGLRIGTTIASTWADATGISATSLSAAIAEVVSDLGGSSGGLRIGTTISATWADTSGIASTNVRGAINEIVSDLGATAGGTRIGVNITSTWANSSSISATTVTGAFDQIVSNLASNPSGTHLIGDNLGVLSPARGAGQRFVRNHPLSATLDDVGYALTDRVAYRQQDLFAFLNVQKAATALSASDAAGGVILNTAASSSTKTPMFVAVVGSGASNIRVSRDGLAFTSMTQGGAATAELLSIAYSPTLYRFVAVGDSGDIQSFDGLSGSWSKRTAGGAFSGTLDRIIWSSNLSKFFAYGALAGSLEIQHSTDGISWTRVTGSSFPGTPTKVFVFGSHIVVYAATNDSIWHSSDGLTFTNVTPSTSFPVKFLTVGHDGFYLGTDDTISAPTETLFSATGLSWTGTTSLIKLPHAGSPEGFSVSREAGTNLPWYFWMTVGANSYAYRPLGGPGVQVGYPPEAAGNSLVRRTSIGWYIQDTSGDVYLSYFTPLYDY